MGEWESMKFDAAFLQPNYFFPAQNLIIQAISTESLAMRKVRIWLWKWNLMKEH